MNIVIGIIAGLIICEVLKRYADWKRSKYTRQQLEQMAINQIIDIIQHQELHTSTVLALALTLMSHVIIGDNQNSEEERERKEKALELLESSIEKVRQQRNVENVR